MRALRRAPRRLLRGAPGVGGQHGDERAHVGVYSSAGADDHHAAVPALRVAQRGAQLGAAGEQRVRAARVSRRHQRVCIEINNAREVGQAKHGELGIHVAQLARCHVSVRARHRRRRAQRPAGGVQRGAASRRQRRSHEAHQRAGSAASAQRRVCSHGGHAPGRERGADTPRLRLEAGGGRRGRLERERGRTVVCRFRAGTGRARARQARNPPTPRR